MVSLLLTLDYELFFGPAAGSVERCLIEPTEAMADLVEKHGMRLTLFVDVGFLCRADAHRGEPEVRRQVELVDRQLGELAERGHDLQLHVHPHWEDTAWTERGWRYDLARYRLHDFEAPARTEIVRRYKTRLEAVAQSAVFAYRAGGWCLQPFEAVAAALADNGVWLDSTVFEGGFSGDAQREFDFRHAPSADHWCFSSDPLVPDANGPFLEVPITPMPLGPRAYWRMAIMPRLSSRFAAFGDGAGMSWSRGYYLDRLLKRSVSPASIDGVKAHYARRVVAAAARRGGGIVNVMGHPKAVSPYSLAELGRLLAENDYEPMTLRDYSELEPGKSSAASAG